MGALVFLLLLALLLFLVGSLLGFIAFARVGGLRARVERLEHEQGALRLALARAEAAAAGVAAGPAAAPPGATGSDAPPPDVGAEAPGAPEEHPATARGAPASEPPEGAAEPAPERTAGSAADAPAAPTPFPPAPPPAASARSPIEILASWWTSANLARTGVALLFVAAALFVRHATASGILPPAVRAVASGGLGVAMLAAGVLLGSRRRRFGLTLEGGGLGVIYLSIFAAYRLYGAIGAASAFALLAALVVAAAVRAVRRGAQPLALLGLIGGLLAPAAAPAAGGTVPLFAWYLALNAGMAAVAAARGWRSLTAAGIVLTYVVGGVWGGLRYAPELYARVQPFLAALFLLHLVAGASFALRRGDEERDPLDAATLFGLPAAVLPLQAALVSDARYGLAWSCLGFALVYAAACALALRARGGAPGGRRLGRAYGGLALGFLALALPFALDPHAVAIGWAVQGAGLVALGARRGSGWLQALGWLLLGGAAFAALLAFAPAGLGLTAVALLGAARLAERAAPDAAGRSAVSAATRDVGAWAGSLLAFAAVAALASSFLDAGGSWDGALLVAVAGTAGAAALFELLARRLAWPHLHVSARLSILPLPPLLALGGAWTAGGGAGMLLATYGAWAAALAATRWAMRRPSSTLGPSGRRVAEGYRLAWLALLAVLATLVLVDALDALPGASWPFAAALATALALTLALADRRGRRLLLAQAPPALVPGRATWIAAALVFVVVALRADGDLAPWPDVPLLNPLDALAVALFVALVRTRRTLRAPAGIRTAPIWLLAGLELLGASALLARAFPLPADAAWGADALLGAPGFQAALSILWGLHALAYLLGARTRPRTVAYRFGALLLSLTLGKLLLVDLAGAGTAARIGSFFAIGVIVLVVAYLLPNAGGEKEAEGG